MRRWLIPFLLLLVGAACAPSGGNPTSAPTLVLIPATATDTATPVPPTATSANLPAPADIVQPTDTATPAGSTTDLTGDALVAQDPVAGELVGIAQRLVADQLNLPTRRIRMVDVRSVVWTDSTLNCPPANSQIVEQDTDGYRIVVQAADKNYLFHTDFDRVVPCEFANERLPDGVIVPTLEAVAEAATSESTSEATVEATSAS
ncbi:MAG: hypothetical protein GC204_02340 [Chloroflexi bacterium]|nr:hypothetical protein [Chloroflexota bacterium]